MKVRSIASQKPIWVTAIVSAYNSERFMRGCLEDLTGQSAFVQGKVEVIVVDSGSPQREREIVREFQDRFPTIRYLRTEQRESVYAAWNRGIKVASGKYLTNANTDDRHKHDAFERMASVLEMKPDVALVYADVIKTATENETFDQCNATGCFRWHDWDRKVLLSQGCFIGPQPMWRRSVHDRYGYFDENLVTSGDYEFWLRISQNFDFYHIRLPLGLYLERPDSIEHRNWELRKTEDARIQELYRRAADRSEIIRSVPLAQLEPPDIKQCCKPLEETGERNMTSHEQMYEALQPLIQSCGIEVAISALRNVIGNFPDFARGHNDIGVLSYQMGDKQRALAHYEKAAALEPWDLTFQKNLADCLWIGFGRLEDAVKIYVDILAAHPRDLETLLALGKACDTLEHFQDAESFFKRALEIDPENAEAQMRLGRACNLRAAG
jgi:glycosyltransferase involved in cell wall biosynthesis